MSTEPVPSGGFKVLQDNHSRKKLPEALSELLQLLMINIARSMESE